MKAKHNDGVIIVNTKGIAVRIKDTDSKKDKIKAYTALDGKMPSYSGKKQRIFR